MLQNETYIGNMVQGRSVKISYKSKKCLKQDPANWVVVEGTHEPLVDAETFQKVRMLVNSRKHTRSRTYDFLLKGLIFCHECGYPLAVLNRKNAKGEDVLYFVCRTYQRFTKAGVCTCHSIKEKTVTDAVIAKVREVCQAYLNPDELLPVAQEAVENAGKQSSLESELQALQSKIDSLTANLDRMYTDRLNRAAARSGLSAHLRPDQAGAGAAGGETAGTGVAGKKPRPQRGQSQGTGDSGSSKRPGRVGNCWSASSNGWS